MRPSPTRHLHRSYLPPRDNPAVAKGLDRVAALLALEPSLSHRVAGYRLAAQKVRSCARPLQELIADEGVEGVHALGIDYLLAGWLVDWIEQGDFPLLRRLEAAHAPLQELERLPGIGPKLASELVAVGITNGEELRHAVLSGRLRKICGFGPRRIQLVLDVLEGLHRQETRHRSDGRQLELGIGAG